MFFGCKTMDDVAELRDIGGLLAGPKYAKWNELRDTTQAAYIGLTMPRVIARVPYNEETNPAGINFTERSLAADEERDSRPKSRPAQEGLDEEHYLWGSAAIPFARNLVASFARSGWCQSIRGPKAGGLVSGLPTHTFPLGGEEVLKFPVEIAMPDFRELELARSGLIPLIQKKGSAEAVFFSAQSIKRAREFKDDHQTENAQLVTNLSYTFSISRIAHYLKCIMRNNIGSTANQQYVFNQIDRWVSRYVTTLVNPDDLTLQYYPFKAYTLDVAPISGKAGWYHCNLTIQPHIQFEGLSVDLRVDARLG
jgi:type VI secretion system protein ImpC